MMAPGALGLGLDLGGTATRWALADASGEVLAQGELPCALPLHITHPASERPLQEHIRSVADRVHQTGRPNAVLAGITGLEGRAEAQRFIANTLRVAFTLPSERIRLCNDLVLGCLDAWAPGEGHLVYAGTGSIGAHIDSARVFHRIGGRGHLLDDAGGGYWIAKEALRRIWRREDEAPGSWIDSGMAQRLFGVIGGPNWQETATFLYGVGRGEIGKLAVHVAASAHDDPLAREILREAGAELARLADLLVRRLGAKPVAVAGGAAHLHPDIFIAMREAMRSEVPCTLRQLRSHQCAAEWAAKPEFVLDPLFPATGENSSTPFPSTPFPPASNSESRT